MWLGMLKAALGQLAAFGPLPGVLAEWLGACAALPAGYIALLAERFAGLPGAQVAAAARLARGRRRGLRRARARGARHSPRSPPPDTRGARVRGALAPRPARHEARRLGRGRGARARRRGRAHAAGGAQPSSPCASSTSARATPRSSSTPAPGRCCSTAGRPRPGSFGLLRGAGVKRLALVVATHASRDHHGGLADVLRSFPVAALLDGGDGSRDPAYRAVLAAAAAARRAPDRGGGAAAPGARAGPDACEVLSPPPRPRGPAAGGPQPARRGGRAQRGRLRPAALGATPRATRCCHSTYPTWTR